MKTGIPISGIAPRSNGSEAGDHFIDLWNRAVLTGRALERRRREALRTIGVVKVIPNDGWVTRIDGVPTSIPCKHPYGEYRSLQTGERIGIGWLTNEREPMVGIYQVVRIHQSPLFSRADIEWVRDVSILTHRRR